MSADQAEPLDESFTLLLAAYDEALAAGAPSPDLAGLHPPPELRPRLERGLACLQRLEEAWPRHAPRADSAPTLSDAPPAAGLDHPNLVPVHEAGEDGAACYIVSAYCPGPTLAQWLRQPGGPVAERAAAELVAALADAVQHAHSRGVLHRDLKPANVMLDGEGQVRITDFGLAVAAGGPRKGPA